MNYIMESVSRVWRGAADSFRKFPVSIGSALAFAVVTVIRIYLEWPYQEPYNFLFHCLHWSFALGALFSLAAITLAQSRFNTQKAFWTANLLGLVVIGLTFLLLYFFGSHSSGDEVTRYNAVSVLSSARVIAAMLISILAFMVVAILNHPQIGRASCRERV